MKKKQNIQSSRVGAIIKIIGNRPGITLSQLLSELVHLGFRVSEKTLTKDIDLLKHEYELLQPAKRLRSGYFLQGMHTIGIDELPVVIDSLWAFGFNLNNSSAWAISNRLGTSRARTLALRQKNIYNMAEFQKGIEETLSIALKEHLCVRISLVSPRLKREGHFEIFPLFKIFYERGWYLISRSSDKKNFFPCRIDRIRSCEVQNTFSPNDDHEKDTESAQFLINAGWGMDFPHSWGEYVEIDSQPEVVVRFHSSVAAFIKEGAERHVRAQMAYAKDGSGHLDFRIRLKYYDEFRNWVRSWGAKAWYLEPQKFVDEERVELTRQASNYNLNFK